MNAPASRLVPGTVFDADARARFADLYPEQPGKIAHGLTGHPLFELEALVELSQRIRPVDVEQNLADLPIEVDPSTVRHNGLSVADSIRSIEANGSWMVLKFVEQDTVYRQLLDEILDELEPVVSARTGAMIKREAFIFVSSPNAVTPFHMDPEHNILLQLRGTKTMTLFPAADPELTPGALQEEFHRGAHRNLPFRDGFATKGQPIELTPGEGLYVPVKAPHWVQNGPATSVSLSVTWRSEWSYREADAHAFNRLLRRAGLIPAMPARYPRQNMLKAYAWRALAKAKRLAGNPDPQ
ncbi:cupin-like domain-containing protein [Sphingomonas sp.]|uniref:cupin-like domain-containing protein n=1 Tax=Sphingomonas sp. TaxID=28214 RepID=UPI002ED8D795